MKNGFEIGGRWLDDDAPCYVIAEIGVNHNGNEAMGHQIIDVAADAGADAVKFQTFDPALVASAGAALAPYQSRTISSVSQRDMLQALVLPRQAWSELAEHARRRHLTFLSTAFDLPSLAILEDLDIPALKVPSGELTNAPFIQALASTGRPLLISTGMAALDEVQRALDAAAGARSVCLLHCVSAYPAPIGESNLRAIATMRERFSVPVGWSDHTEGTVTGVAAVTIGAVLLEKHLTLNRSLSGPDHAASANPETFRAYVRAIREAESALGDGDKRPMPSEQENRVHARRGLHTARRLKVGQPIDAADLVCVRPATGLAPGTPLAGLRVRRNLPAGVPLTEHDVIRDEGGVQSVAH